MHHYIVLLSDLSYQLGLIGIAEYEERREVAHWLSMDGEGKPDPRSGRHEEQECPRENDEIHENDGAQRRGGSGSANSTEENPTHRWPQFLAFNKWMFTVGDRDCYPSVPHGHLHRKTNEWPKLNPYTGRVFAGVHAEDVSSRLTKAEMKTLWNNEDFVELCRKQVLWYSDFAPDYAFPSARFGRLRFPKW
ncbi:MAG: hypothetical protein AMXMBFR6_24240 [Betaproteobacteria bacterium]